MAFLGKFTQIISSTNKNKCCNVRGASNYNKYFFLRVRENATL